jgi:hypothetical protein
MSRNIDYGHRWTDAERARFQPSRDAARTIYGSDNIKIGNGIWPAKDGGLWVEACVYVGKEGLATPRDPMRALIEQIAGMTPYSIDASDDKLDDAVATMNSLIAAAKKITSAKA